MSDILFSTIERFHGTKPWGRFLDAGTGLHSLKWIQTLPTTSWTSITADMSMYNLIKSNPDVAKLMRSEDELVVGNWMDDKFISGMEKYDTILADYLIGAVDGFSPYEQDEIISRLKSKLNSNGRLYFVNMNPIPDTALPPSDLIAEIRRVRDACILLAGHRPYREFPLSWMERHIKNSGMKVVDSKTFTILHSEESAIRQIRVAQSKLPYMSTSVRNGMEPYLLELESKVKEAMRQSGRIPLSYDYVLSVEHAPDHDR